MDCQRRFLSFGFELNASGNQTIGPESLADTTYFHSEYYPLFIDCYVQLVVRGTDNWLDNDSRIHVNVFNVYWYWRDLELTLTTLFLTSIQSYSNKHINMLVVENYF